MLENGEKLGAFVVPTGIGASIGGFAGDASPYAREFAKESKLIVNPNVVNAGCFSGITDNMLYVEGYSLDEFFKGNINLIPSQNNKIGVVFDSAITSDVLNVHINTINAAKAVYGIDIASYELTSDDVGVEFKLEDSGISTGIVKNIDTLKAACQKLLQKGCNALALVCLFEDPQDDNPDYAKLNEKLDELAQEYQVNKTAIAIAWLLRHPAIMQPIVGTTSPKHLQETVAAIDVELTRQQWYDLYLASGKPLP